MIAVSRTPAVGLTPVPVKRLSRSLPLPTGSDPRFTDGDEVGGFGFGLSRIARVAVGRITLIAMLATAATALVSGAAQAQTGYVWTNAGLVQGAAPDAQDVTAFKGIPYAAPPTGALRWRPPQPAPHWDGVRATTNFGSACLAAPVPGPAPAAGPPQSEDCLTVNVWTPAPYDGAAKPVMVWLHGGGFQFGSSASPTYDGSHLAGRDVVVVSLNYRLGVLGFLASPELDQESGSSGAYGLQDQLAALRWVRENIAKFGGDPTRVTLFGESAGAHAVGLLLASQKSRGLVSSAIAESGAFWDTARGSLLTHQEALAKGRAFFDRFAGQDIRAVAADQINSAGAWDYVSDPEIQAFAPSVDGQVLRASPADVFARGEQLNVPLLGGWNEAEYFVFLPFALPYATPDVFDAAARQLFGDRCLPLFKALYPASSPDQARASSFLLDGDLTIAEQTWEMLSLPHRPESANVYAYKFSYTSPYSPIASHTAEVSFVFGNLTPQRFAPQSTAATEDDRKISDLIMGYWTNFARQGNPNGTGLPFWPVYKESRSLVMQLNANSAAGPNTDVDRFRFIASYRKHGRFPAAWRTLGAGFNDHYPRVNCYNADF